MAEIRLEGVRKTFGKVTAVGDITLTVQDREFMVLLGPSGCGKTTLLRSIAGLEQIDAGRVIIGGQDVTDLPPRRRRIAMVFQSYAVFPHLTVFQNIAFGLHMQRRPPDQVQARVHSAGELLQITDLLDRYPSQLSGGQRQRVAVARAIAVQPEVLLMDEPLSNLDSLLRLQMRAELKRLLREIQATTIYVTHDQVEALSLGDRIAVMREGAIIQCDTPLVVYDEPSDIFVGSFIGSPPMNFLPGMVKANTNGAEFRIGDRALRLPAELAARAPAESHALLGIRAENIEVSFEPTPDALPAQVMVIEPLGSHNLLTVQVGAHSLKVTTRADLLVEPGRSLWLRPQTEKMRLYPQADPSPQSG